MLGSEPDLQAHVRQKFVRFPPRRNWVAS